MMKENASYIMTLLIGIYILYSLEPANQEYSEAISKISNCYPRSVFTILYINFSTIDKLLKNIKNFSEISVELFNSFLAFSYTPGFFGL